MLVSGIDTFYLRHHSDTGAAVKNAATDPLALICRAFFASSAPRLFASRLCWIARCRAFAVAPAKGTQRLVEGRSGSSAPAVAGLGPCQKDSLAKGPAGYWLSHFGAPISWLAAVAAAACRSTDCP